MDLSLVSRKGLPPPQALLIKAVIGAGVNLGMRGRFKHLRERRGGVRANTRSWTILYSAVYVHVCVFYLRIYSVYSTSLRTS